MDKGEARGLSQNILWRARKTKEVSKQEMVRLGKKYTYVLIQIRIMYSALLNVSSFRGKKITQQSPEEPTIL